MSNEAMAATESHSGSGSSPTEWVDLYGDYLFKFAIGQVRNDTVAEDLVQETFLSAFKGRARFAGDSTERTWFVSILRHKILDYLRHSSRRKTFSLDSSGGQAEDEVTEGSMVWLHEVAADCLEPHRRMELDEFRHSLQSALGRLPERISQVFQMYEIGGQSGRDVCAAMGISEQNLWVMLHRARKQLRGELQSWWDGDYVRDGSRRRQNSRI
jgi:RNA polymerase sigma-70 factor (ECF subfamily)